MTINLSNFKNELNTHFVDMPHLVTEDLIRQYFIDVQPLNKPNTTIEMPYRCLKIKKTFWRIINNRARADLYYNGLNTSTNETEDIVIEFKYHKQVKHSTTCKTTNMGEVFRDLNRLSTLDNNEKYFIYVFDQEMKDYYDKHSTVNFLKIDKKTFDINIKTMNKISKDDNGEFYKSAFSSFSDDCQDFSKFNYSIKTIFKGAIIKSYYLIILQIV